MRQWLACALLTGCANFSVRPAGQSDAPGLHFFVPKPYILIWWERDIVVKSGTVLQSLVPRHEVLLLPDLAQRYAITQHAFFSKGDFAFQLRDGWRLESINSKLDTTEVVRMLKDTGLRLIDRTMAQSLTRAPAAEEQTIPPPVLFEPVWDPDAATYIFRPVPLPGLLPP